MKIKIVDYNNKSRKGRYITITLDKKRKIYKYNDNYPIDFYVEIAKGSLERNKTIKRGKVNKKRILTELERVTKGKESKFLRKMNVKYSKYKNKKLDSYFKKGYRTITEDLSKLATNPVKYYRKLLSPLVLDKELLDILMQNSEKFKHRFWYYIENKGIIVDNKTKDKKVTTLSFHEDKMKTPINLIQSYNTKFTDNAIVNRPKLEEKIKSLNGINAKYYIGYNEKAILRKTMITITFSKDTKKPQYTPRGS